MSFETAYLKKIPTTIDKVCLKEIFNSENFEQFKHIFCSLSKEMSVELLSIQANLDLLTKKGNILFISKIMNYINNLPEKTYENFLTITNEQYVFSQKNYHINYVDVTKKISTMTYEICHKSLKINKRYLINDLKELEVIKNKFNFTEVQFIRLASKLISCGNNKKLLKYNNYSHFLENKQLQKIYVKNLIEKNDNIEFLDEVFKLYEPVIYNIYLELKDKNKIWESLTNKVTGTYKRFDDPKSQWFDTKNIGYKNHPTPYLLDFIHINYCNNKNLSFFNEDYYYFMIEKSINYFEKQSQTYYPQFFENHKNKRSYEWEMQIRKDPILNPILPFIKDEDFQKICKKIVLEKNLNLSLKKKENKTTSKKI